MCSIDQDPIASAAFVIMIRPVIGVVIGTAVVVVLLAICVRPTIHQDDHELAVAAVAAVHAGDPPGSFDMAQAHSEVCEWERVFWVGRTLGMDVVTDAGQWAFKRLAALNCD